MDVSISKESMEIKEAQMCRRKTGGTGKTTSKHNKREVNGRSPVKTEKNLQAQQLYSYLYTGSMF